MIRFSSVILSVLLSAVGVSVQAATVVPLNDTGQTACYDSAGAVVSCATNKDDGNYGRDAAYAAGALTKTGAGNAGFDFTKIANNGTTLGAGAALGGNPTDWACTRDNVTGLTWEVKTTDGGLRDWSNTYTWYSTDSASNGGNAGTASGGACTGSINCDTQSYVAAVNALNSGAGLCNHNDWRMPSGQELHSLFDSSAGWIPWIDATYFPNTQADSFWSANNYSPDPAYAWLEFLGYGWIGTRFKTDSIYVRLVRGGQ